MYVVRKQRARKQNYIFMKWAECTMLTTSMDKIHLLHNETCHFLLKIRNDKKKSLERQK